LKYIIRNKMVYNIFHVEEPILSETNIHIKKELINILAAKLRIFFIKNNNEYILKLDSIIKIDGIHVSVCISRNNENQYTYRFETVHLASIEPNATKPRIIVFESENNFYELSELFDEFEMVKNTYIFYEKSFVSPKAYENIQKNLLLNPDICPVCLKPTIKCSICYENTCLYTICNHALCLKCRDNCIELEKVNCPICRGKNIKYINLHKEQNKFYYNYDDMEKIDLKDLI